jgi:ABC-type nitrate/sulfonate/bicarbonate transport system substrate-binding protein
MATPGTSRHLGRRRAVWMSATLAVVALVATACSSSGKNAGTGGGTTGASSSAAGSAAPAASQSSGASQPCPNGCKLTVVTPNTDPSSAITIYVADDLGLFKKYGVNVTRINGVAAGSVPLLTSGKADIIDEGATTAFPVAKQGMQISEIFNDIGGGALGGLAVSTKSSYQSVDDLSGKKVGTVGTTGTQYGFTNLFSNDVKKDKGKGFTITPFTDNTTLINSVESGAIAGAGGSKSIFAAEIAAGKLRMVADTSVESQRVALLGTSYTADTAFAGLKKNLTAKQEAVTRFLEACVEANIYLNTHPLSDIAPLLDKDPLFKTLGTTTILQHISAQVPFFTPNKGFISESLWNTTLSLFDRWDIPSIGNPSTDPTYSYANIVDMSYLTAAMQRVGVTPPSQ